MMATFSKLERMIHIALAFFLISLIPSVLFSVNTAKSLQAFYVFLSGGLAYYIVLQLAQRDGYRKYLKGIWYLIIAYTVCIAIKGIYQYQVLGILRPRSIVGYANIAAKHYDLVFPFASVILIMQWDSLRKRFLWGSLSLILAYGLLVTGTRAAWLSNFFVLLTILFMQSKKTLFYVGGVLVLGIAAMAAVGHNGFLAERLESIADPTNASNTGRIYIWLSCLQIIKDFPLTGVGLNVLENVFPAYLWPGAREIAPHAHNIWLALASEAGIPSAILFTVFIGAAGMYIYRGFSLIVSENYKVMILGMALSCISFLLHGLVDYPLYKEALWLFFMFEIAFSIGIIKYFLNRQGVGEKGETR